MFRPTLINVVTESKLFYLCGNKGYYFTNFFGGVHTNLPNSLGFATFSILKDSYVQFSASTGPSSV